MNETFKQSQVTIHDIASEARVSPSTVSRVLNGSAPVSVKKRTRVQQAIEKLDYRPNIIAQGLARGKSMAIGVLTQNIASQFYGEILMGIEQGLDGTGYHPLFATGRGHADEERAAVEVLIKQRVEAIIVVGADLPDQDLRQVADRMPVVAVGRSFAGFENHVVQVENFQGANSATRYLIELGHTHIAHITGKMPHPHSIARADGYRHALANAGIDLNPSLVVEGNFGEQSGVLAVEILLTRGVLFTAIFAANDQMAYGARLALYRRGIRVPEDISLVGFDDQPDSAYTTPPLTTVRQPAFKMGIAAVQAARQLIQGQEPSIPTFSTELIIRESAAIYRPHGSVGARLSSHLLPSLLEK